MTAFDTRGTHAADGLDRRGFLRGLAQGGALLFGAGMTGGGLLSAQALRTPGGSAADGAAADPLKPSIWVAIHPDGAVSIWAHRSEMGTGIRTSLPMVVADELGADWDKVTIEQALGDRAYGSQNTDGSRSIRRFYDGMRAAGAAARMVLEQAAAQTWGVDAKECKATAHAVHGPGGKSLGFGDLVAKARELDVPDEKDLVYKPASERRYVGTDEVKFYDVDDIVQGKGHFGADVKLDGMLYATVWRVPVLGGGIEDFDATKAKAVPGVVEVIELDPYRGAPAFQALGGIAVVATNTWAAMKGREALDVEWEKGDRGEFDSQKFAAEMQATAKQDGTVVRSAGDVAKGMAAAKSKHSADYSVPFLSHVPMEPPVTLARVTDDKCEVWAPTQNPQAAQGTLAQTLRMPANKVDVHVTLLGGGFGRKSKPDYCVEAALISKAMDGKPVRVQWTREDDIRFDYYHSPAAVHVEAGVDEAGQPVAWKQRTVFPSIGSTFNPAATVGNAGELHMGFTDIPYPLANLQCEVGPATAGTRIGWLRSVHHIQHAFAECSFVDELAAKAGQDRLEYLDTLIGEPRHVDMTGVEYSNQGEPLEKFPVDTGRLKNVLHHVAEKAGWGRQLGEGRGLGIAAHRSFLSYVAVVIEVAVTKDGRLTIPRLDIGIDCGLVVNPDRVRAQLEGAAVFGVSLALMGEITFADGAVVQSNFHDYPVARMSEAPEVINTYLLPNENPPAGVGEPGVPPIAPALCNAIFAATGKRVRDLPIRKHDLSWG